MDRQEKDQSHNRRAAAASLRQFVKFNIVGVANTLIDMAVYFVLRWLGLYFVPAQIISYGCGIVNSYVCNKLWTFGGRSAAGRGEWWRFALLNGGTLLVSLGLLYLFTKRMALPEAPAKIVATGCAMLVNFAGSKLWVFRVPPRPRTSEDA